MIDFFWLGEVGCEVGADAAVAARSRVFSSTIAVKSPTPLLRYGELLLCTATAVPRFPEEYESFKGLIWGGVR